MEGRYGSLVGGIHIWPSLCWFQLPCHSQVDLSSLNGLKAWGRDKNSAMTSLSCWYEQRRRLWGGKNCGLSIIWVNPSQARVPSMEEAVVKLTASVSSRPNWPYALVQLHEGTCHVPLPKEGHLGSLPQRGVEAVPCGQISQLDVCQLLVAGPQVINPMGLNGCDEPVIIHLPEPLASGVSYHWQACLPGNQYPTIPSGGATPKGTTSW